MHQINLLEQIKCFHHHRPILILLHDLKGQRDKPHHLQSALVSKDYSYSIGKNVLSSDIYCMIFLKLEMNPDLGNQPHNESNISCQWFDSSLEKICYLHMFFVSGVSLHQFAHLINLCQTQRLYFQHLPRFVHKLKIPQG